MKVIVAGSRSFNDFDRMVRVMDQFHRFTPITEVVSGGAGGADKLGERWAASRGIPIRLFLAQWKALGKRAGFVRNQEMADYGDQLVLFWDGESHGSKDMAHRAGNKPMPVVVEFFEPPPYPRPKPPATKVVINVKREF